MAFVGANQRSMKRGAMFKNGTALSGEVLSQARKR
jgi:hypothetical protein